MDRASSATNGHILLDMNAINESAELTPPWELTLRIEAHLTVKGWMQESNVVHQLGRDEAGEWHIDSDRGDGEVVHLSGSGALPAIVELNGAIMILMPTHVDGHTRDIPPASTS